MASLIGLFRLGKDAELKQMPNGESVTKLSLAYNFGKKDGSGNRSTQWVDASLFGKRAEALTQYLKKGVQVFADVDDVHVRQWQDKDGQNRYSLNGIVSKIEFAGTRQPNASSNEQTAQRRHAQVNFEDDDVPF